MLLLLLLSHFSCVRLCATPETAAHQAPLSLGFSRQEHWSGKAPKNSRVKQHKCTTSQPWRLQVWGHSVSRVVSSEVSLLGLETPSSLCVLMWSFLCVCLCPNLFFLWERQSYYIRTCLYDCILNFIVSLKTLSQYGVTFWDSVHGGRLGLLHIKFEGTGFSS